MSSARPTATSAGEAAGPGLPFAVIATQRTGSTLLVRSLDSSPDIFCAGEIFRSGPHIYHGEFSYSHSMLGSNFIGKLADRLVGKRRVARHLDRFYGQAGRGVRAVGFKVMASQLRRHRAILDSLRERDAKLVFLHRRDSFATAISYCKARATGVFHSDRVGGSNDAESFAADPGEFGELLRRCESEKSEILSLHASVGGMLLAYEDMSYDWVGFIRSVGHALGIDGLTLPPALEKLGTAAPRIRIENEAELRRAFSGRIEA